MSRALITLTDGSERAKAVHWIGRAPAGTRVEFKQAQRSGAQNDRFWAMLTDVATQVPWHGVKLKPDDWKFIFLDALKRELRMVPNLDGTGFVNLGRSSSDLAKAEMSDLIELIHAFGAEHGVTFHDPDYQSEGGASQQTNSREQVSPVAETVTTPIEAAQVDHAGEKLAPTNSNSSLAPSPAETDTPATSDHPPALVAGNISGLPDGWRKTYVETMNAASDKPRSLPSRHTEALKQIGGTPSESDLEEMRAIYGLRDRNLKGQISAEDYRTAIRELVGDLS